MQFSEVDKIVGERFPGKYRCLSFEQTTTAYSEIETKCGIYVDGCGWYYARTFAAALGELNHTNEEPQEIAA